MIFTFSDKVCILTRCVSPCTTVSCVQEEMGRSGQTVTLLHSSGENMLTSPLFLCLVKVFLPMPVRCHRQGMLAHDLIEFMCVS